MSKEIIRHKIDFYTRVNDDNEVVYDVMIDNDIELLYDIKSFEEVIKLLDDELNYLSYKGEIQ